MTELMLVIAPVAQEDLRNIYLYGMRTWGEQQAGDYLDLVRDCFWHLTIHPDIGVSRPELGQHLRSFVVKQHVVFYRLKLDQLQIVRVLHGRQEPELHFSYLAP
ncbi:type II toxin-antitoxin system RelE/ParE family toxin [Pseudomonas lopnurensis]|uniref:type II toxin-antitoxin system RelE/ParE family toxin n=1 Tax=Pseudomonas lopnurensis TaxID=1477517 RepID=UPI00187A170D|nr:type II toxin-antitoxin system RelE/ParE family toxin [Pseudomonas lopnurensis]MBE7373026.1 type II toxin-antitoxin system RelE/ParE family toxin [Pseudomonas lopnurensis]